MVTSVLDRPDPPARRATLVLASLSDHKQRRSDLATLPRFARRLSARAHPGPEERRHDRNASPHQPLASRARLPHGKSPFHQLNSVEPTNA